MHKPEQNRQQFQMWSLEAAVATDSIVRVIDVLVDQLDLKELGFTLKGQIKNGAPAFRASDLLKLYYYGYLNRVRSSRRLEREVKTNLEAMWLLKESKPGYKTIANFRKDNPKALLKVFSLFNRFLKGEDLFDEDIVAIDGSKFRAVNSKKNNYNDKKVKQHLEYIDRQSNQYLEELDQIDLAEEETESQREQRMEIAQKLNHLHLRKNKYDELQAQVENAREEGQTQISTVDPDARALPKKMNIVEVGYNVLTAAEQKNKFITNFQITNQLDIYALSAVAKDARTVLEKEDGVQLIVLADKGFDTGSELKKCSDKDILTLVAPKKRVHAKKDKAFNKDAFFYDAELDVYICPQDQHLSSNGKWYQKNNGQHRKAYKVRHYKLPFAVCNACPFREACAGQANLNNSKGRYIERSEYQTNIDENIERVKLNKELYRKRQQIVEHQFGTIKRQWGYDHTLLRTKAKVAGEFAIIFTVYNLRRAVSILGIAGLIKRIKEAWHFLKQDLRLILRPHTAILFKNLSYLFSEKPREKSSMWKLCWI